MKSQKTPEFKVKLTPPQPYAQRGLRLSNYLTCSTGLAFLLLFQLIFWMIIPLLGHHTPPLDVIEMTTWANTPQWGYYKHPPLPAWGIYLSEMLFGRAPVALFFASAFSIVLATWAVWPLAVRMFGQKRALVALFIQSCLIYYNLYSPDYNHNVAQIPFWALSVTAFYLALVDGRTRYWVAFGLALGMTTLAKYSAAFLPVACVILLIWESNARRFLNVSNILASAAAYFVVTGPHIQWLMQNNYAPIMYMRERIGDLAQNATWSERFISYTAMQLLVHIVLICVMAWVMRSAPMRRASDRTMMRPEQLNDYLRSSYDRRQSASAARQPDPNDKVRANYDRRSIDQAPRPDQLNDRLRHGYDRRQVNIVPVTTRLNDRFLLVMGLGPFALTVLYGLSGSFLHPMWASAMFPISGLLVVRVLQVRAERLLRWRWLAGWLILMTILGGVYVIKNTQYWYALSNKYARASYPAPELARQLDAKWRAAFPGKPLLYVIGTPWEAGAYSFESQFTTKVLIDGNFTYSPWVMPREVLRCGAIIVWDKAQNMLPKWRETWPQLQAQQNLVVKPDRVHTYPLVLLAWAILPPTEDCSVAK